MDTWTTLRALDWTASRFASAGIESARLDAQVLLAHVLNTDRVGLYTRYDRPLESDELAAYRELIKSRLAGRPVAYLVGYKEFWSLKFAVDERVLIPRPDTETLVQAALEFAREHRATNILEIATGSGAVALALGSELPGASITATDVSKEALEVAHSNAASVGLAERVTFLCGDLFAPIDNSIKYDLLVANLPYVPSAEVDTLAPEVRSEPKGALDGGADGLVLIRKLVAEAAGYVRQGGGVFLECASPQKAAIEKLALASGAKGIRSHRDLAGRHRVSSFVV